MKALKAVFDFVGTRLWRWMQWLGWNVLAGLAIYAGVRLGHDTHEAGELIAAFGVALIGAVMMVVGPTLARQTVARVSKISIGSFGVELSQVKSGPVQEDTGNADLRKPHDLTDLRLNLEAKMAYVAKHMLAPDPASDEHPGIPAYLTIGSLEYDGYLTRDQGRLASHVLAVRPDALAMTDPAERRRYLEDAQALVVSFRAIVFRAMVRKVLEKDGWQVAQVYDDDDVRRDLQFRSGPPAGPKHRAVPVFATNEGSPLLTKPTERLEKLKERDTVKEKKRVIVVPDNSRVEVNARSDPAIVKLSELQAHLTAVSAVAAS